MKRLNGCQLSVVGYQLKRAAVTIHPLLGEHQVPKDCYKAALNRQPNTDNR